MNLAMHSGYSTPRLLRPLCPLSTPSATRQASAQMTEGAFSTYMAGPGQPPLLSPQPWTPKLEWTPTRLHHWR